MKRSTIAVGILSGIACTAIISVVALTAWLVNTAMKPRALGGPMWSSRVSELALRHDDYAEARKIFRTKLLREGPSPQPVTEEYPLPVGMQMITGATAVEIDAERERQRRLFAFLYSTPAYQRTLELYGWDDLGPHLRDLIRADRWDDLATVVTDEILDTLVPAARYVDVPARVRERLGGLADGVLLAPPPDPAHDHLVAAAVADLHVS